MHDQTSYSVDSNLKVYPLSHTLIIHGSIISLFYEVPWMSNPLCGGKYKEWTWGWDPI